MTEGDPKALLPAGLRDLLPPDAAHESAVVEALLESFATYGYERVKPPLIEFEEIQVGGEDDTVSARTFRLMDPVSQRMMGVRADMTLSVARIATTRLRNDPRPVRVCYAGEVLRVRGTQLSPERQFCQVGAELIGAAQAAAGDAEVVLLAAEALNSVGVGNLSIDLSQPTLIPALCDALALEAAAARRLRAALDRKDAAAVAALESEAGIDGGGVFSTLLAAAGPADRVLQVLADLDLPRAAAAEADRLAEVARLILAASPDTRLTIDPVENRGFEYHSGVTFTIFADKVRGELGSGGRYQAGPGADDGSGEPATGFSLFMNSVMRALPEPKRALRLFVPEGVPRVEAADLRSKGWITVCGLTPAEDSAAEAKRLACDHLYLNGRIVPIAK